MPIEDSSASAARDHVVTVTFNDQEKAGLVGVARKEERSMAQVLRRALVYYLEHQKEAA